LTVMTPLTLTVLSCLFLLGQSIFPVTVDMGVIRPDTCQYVPKFGALLCGNLKVDALPGEIQRVAFNDTDGFVLNGSTDVSTFIGSSTTGNDMLTLTSGNDYEETRDVLCVCSNDGFSSSNGRVTVWDLAGPTPVQLFEATFANTLPGTDWFINDCVIQPGPNKNDITVWATENYQGYILKIKYDGTTKFPTPQRWLQSDILSPISGSQISIDIAKGVNGLDFFYRDSRPMLLVTYTDAPGSKPLYTIDLTTKAIAEVTGTQSDSGICYANGLNFHRRGTGNTDYTTVVVSCSGNSTNTDAGIAGRGQVWRSSDGWRSANLLREQLVTVPTLHLTVLSVFQFRQQSFILTRGENNTFAVSVYDFTTNAPTLYSSASTFTSIFISLALLCFVILF